MKDEKLPALGPLGVTCPNCQSKPGYRCTVPTDMGRKNVDWYHLSREAEANKP